MNLTEEKQLRKHIQQAIQIVRERKNAQDINEIRLKELIRAFITETIVERDSEELQLRAVISEIINEAKYDKDPEIRKRRSTGVNALADVSDKLVSELEIGYQTLTTDPEQRKSYRLHFIINLVNILESAIPSGGRRPEDDELFSEHQAIEMEVDSNFLSDDSVRNAELNRQKEEELGDEEEDKYVQFEDSERAGRNYALETIERLETNLLEAYTSLANPRDRTDFRKKLFEQIFLRFQTMTTNMTADLESADYEAEQADIKKEYKAFITGELTFDSI